MVPARRPKLHAAAVTLITRTPITAPMATRDMEGTKAPAFNLKDQDGTSHKLSDYKGRWVVLYFYPKDDTPGCTKEACGFRDAWNDYEKADIAVLGVSPDTVESHRKFVDKYELPFTLLADPDHKLCEKYDVWKEKNMYGKRFWGVARTTFLIDPEGKIARVYSRVKVEEHAGEILGEIVESGVS